MDGLFLSFLCFTLKPINHLIELNCDKKKKKSRAGPDSKHYHFEKTLAMISVVSLPEITALDCILRE